jgi:hypothetical protein
MFSIVIDICKNVLDFVIQNKTIKNNQKETISNILLEISNILEDTANKLSIGEYPHGNCIVMERLSNNLHFNLIDLVPQEDIDRLHDSLLKSSNLEKEYANRENPETIKSIKMASGEFKSMSILIKF